MCAPRYSSFSPVRAELTGTLRENVTAKDVMLYILLHYAKPQMTLDRIMEFTGPGLRSLSMDERATLANMATECAARTAIIEADEKTFAWIKAMRPDVDVEALKARAVAPPRVTSRSLLQMPLPMCA